MSHLNPEQLRMLELILRDHHEDVTPPAQPVALRQNPSTNAEARQAVSAPGTRSTGA